MIRVVILLAMLGFNHVSTRANEMEIKTEVNEVTVFPEGAQITRRQEVRLARGETVLRFINLSPFIDARSVQVKASGDITVLSVNHQLNFLEKLDKPKELLALEAKLTDVENSIRLENTHLSILREEVGFLRDNRVIGGRNQEVSVTNLQEASNFYGSKLSALMLTEIELVKRLTDLNREKQEIENQIRTMTGQQEYPGGEILVKVDALKDQGASFEISYIVSNAGWFPSYDIRAKNINEPIRLIYKANVRQDTKEDWKDVKLRFSSSEPNVSGVAPVLKPYYLNYNILPPAYHRNVGMVSGTVFDSNQDPIHGATVIVSGTTIGTVTDMRGNYSLTIPPHASNLTFTFIGYVPQTLPITSQVMNVMLEEAHMALQEVVVTGYGRKGLAQQLSGRVAGISLDEEIRVRGVSSPVPVAQVEYQTTVDFEINIPFTINSDNKNHSVDMAVYELPAFYQYLSVPKIDRGAFLIANIVDWEKYSLLEGEANIFFEDTYVGKTILDVKYASDTLMLSLGRDKSISVNREKRKELTSRRFMGNRKEEVRNWQVTVKNNKSQNINMVIFDQVPVSTNSEIEVIVQRISGARHNAENGEVKWEFNLAPQESRDFEIQYSVRFPRNRMLVVE
jgi:hypothetical protein